MSQSKAVISHWYSTKLVRNGSCNEIFPISNIKMQNFFLSEFVEVIQTHKKTMCDTLTHQGQAICFRHSKQVPSLKALQKGSFPQSTTLLCPLWSLITKIIGVYTIYVAYNYKK